MNTTQAKNHFGSKKKLADALGISPGAVTLWKEEIPRLRQFQIQMLTSGALQADPLEQAGVDTASSKAPVLTSGPDGAVIPSSEMQKSA
ncbi:Cro/CI family transcriptional regulator [Pseudomonas huanghezhanensis]|uniref:Cro/CI family transcriptional regulator n=1 Tax=Pseudomonas huanghezhanensis TaxID=3002903 RepID=UPI002E20C5E9